MRKNKRCPKCGQWISYDPNIHVDIVHQCRESDGETRLTSRREKDHDFTRFTLKVDDPNLTQFGIDPQMPDSTINKSKFKDVAKRRINVDKFIELSD